MSALEMIFDYFEAFSEENDVSEDVRIAIHLATEELFVNCVKHASTSTHDVVFEVAIEGDKLVIYMIDRDVEPFDVTASSESEMNKPITERRSGGMGLHLVKSIVDEISYDYSNRTSTVRLTKRLESERC
jgi:serine/threonine-protein kinase RsbW